MHMQWSDDTNVYPSAFYLFYSHTHPHHFFSQNCNTTKYKIVSADNGQILYRSVLRSALDTNNPNSRALPEHIFSASKNGERKNYPSTDFLICSSAMHRNPVFFLGYLLTELTTSILMN